MSPVVLGIHLATATARITAMDADTGAVLASRRGALPAPWGSDGAREQDPAYAPVVLALLRGITADLGAHSSAIAALSVTAAPGTVVPTDLAGRPSAVAVLGDDTRETAELRQLRDAGLGIRPSVALARAAWLHTHRPGQRYLFPPDVVLARLAGRILPTDTSHALVAGIDPVAGAWDAAALECLGLGRSLFSELVGPGRVLGEVAPGVASEAGLPRGVLLVSGMVERCAAQLASGAVGRADTGGVLGAGLVLTAVSRVAITDPVAGIFSHPAPDGGFWASGRSRTGMALLPPDAGGGDRRRADLLAAALPPAALVSYPLARPGEQFPLSDPHFAGFLLASDGRPVRKSLLQATARYRAVLDGVAFVERVSLERFGALGVTGGRHHLSGYAASSALWNTIRASTLGHPVFVPLGTSRAVGAAILASIGLTGDPLGSAVERLVPAPTAIDPDPQLAEAMDAGYRVFCDRLALERHPVTHPA